MSAFIDLAFGWLATALLHGTLALAVAWLLTRFLVTRSLPWREAIWRGALWFGIVTATLQSLAGATPDARIVVARDAKVATAAAKAPVAAPAGAARPARAAPITPASTAPGAAPAARAWRLPSLPAWHEALVALWLAAIATTLVALARARWRLEVAVAAMPTLEAPAVDREAAELAALARVRTPLLRTGDSLASPLAAFGDTICLPRWSLDASREARAAMLAHEVAHLARRDTLWRALDVVAQSLLAHHPLALLARRRLATLAELSCDAWAARATGAPRALAESLLHCAEQCGRQREPLLAVAMASSRSPLVERVHSLLEERPMGPLKMRAHGRALVLAMLVAGAFVLPAIGIAGIAAAAGKHGSRISIIDDGSGERMSVDVSIDGVELEAKSRGKFTFTPNEDDVATIESGARLEIEETRAGATRRIEFTPGNGGVAREYSVDGNERPLDAEGRRWMAQVIPTLLRETGLFAEDRVQRFLAKGGPGSVLDEVGMIGSDYARRTYLIALFDATQLDAGMQDRVLATVDAIGSDFERRTSLESLIETQALGEAQQVRLLKSAAAIGSDFEKRTVLEALAPKLARGPEVRRAWGATLATIASDFERRTAIVGLVDAGDLDATTVESALAAAATIGSDFEKRESLRALAPHVAHVPAQAKAYAAAAQGIGSDFDRRETLLALVETDELDRDGYAAVLEACSTMGSDFERGQVLQGVAEKMPGDADLIARYRRIARSLGDHERGQAEKALDRFAS